MSSGALPAEALLGCASPVTAVEALMMRALVWLGSPDPSDPAGAPPGGTGPRESLAERLRRWTRRRTRRRAGPG